MNIRVKDIPPGLPYCEFQLESSKQTGISYVGPEGRGIAQAAYGRYIAYHNLKAKMGKPSTDFEVVPVGTMRELNFLRHLYKEIDFWDGAILHSARRSFTQETGQEVPDAYKEE